MRKDHGLNPLRTLTARDHLVLHNVGCYRYLTSAQVARLHFRTHKGAHRRLRHLAAAGFLHRFRAAEATRAGFQSWWYCLSRAGARIASTGASLLVVPTRHPRSLWFLIHHASVTDFRLWLHEAWAGMVGFSYDYLPSHAGGKGHPALPLGADGLLFPDGAFSLTKGERTALFFLETDRGTEPLTGKHPSAITRKVTAYRRAFDTQAEAHLVGFLPAAVSGFRILWVVPDAARQARLVELAQQRDLSPLVWVATARLTQERGRLDTKAWTVTKPDDLHALSE